MGNCFGKKKNKNRVGPDTSEIIGQNTTFQQPTIEQQKDMVNDLKVNVGLNEGDRQRMPSRLADRLDGPRDEEEGEDKKEVEYTDEEKVLMAELLRDDIVREKKEKAAREEEKVKQAAKRREEMEKQKMEKLGHQSVQKEEDVDSMKDESV